MPSGWFWISECFGLHGLYIFLEFCEATQFCCSSGIQGDQECQGRCIEESWINDGEKDCNNGSDEEVIGIIWWFICEYEQI